MLASNQSAIIMTIDTKLEFNQNPIYLFFGNSILEDRDLNHNSPHERNQLMNIKLHGPWQLENNLDS